MTYFKFLSILFGAWMFLGGVGAVFFMESLKRLIARLYPEGRPRWIVIVGGLVLLLTLGTWAQFLKAMSLMGFVVTLTVSLGLAKVAPFFFFYNKSREILLALVSETLAFRVVMLSSAAIGLALLTMGIFF